MIQVPVIQSLKVLLYLKMSTFYLGKQLLFVIVELAELFDVLSNFLTCLIKSLASLVLLDIGKLCLVAHIRVHRQSQKLVYLLHCINLLIFSQGFVIVKEVLQLLSTG